MDALDGNAIAGTLLTVFGTEMTTATGTCASCGTRSMVGEFGVYLRAPGVVVRCRRCDNVSWSSSRLTASRASTCAD